MATVAPQRDAPFSFVDPVDAFAAFCLLLRTDRGGRFRLEDWQRGIAKSILVDGIVETVVLIPKGNGKTTLLAALALWHLLTTDEARCYIGAASAQQAGEMFRHARRFVERDAAASQDGGGELASLVTVKDGYKQIVRNDDGGIIEVRAADASTQDGVGPTLALVDEYHRHPTDGLYSVFRDGLDKRDGQLVVISTAGDGDDTPLGRLRLNLREHIVKTDGRYVYAYDEEGGACLHEWALFESDDPTDLELVKLANPLSTITVAKLRRRLRSPSMTPGKWQRLTCNLWGTGDEAAIVKPELRARLDRSATIPDGAEIFLGVDLGWRWDTTGMAAVWWCEETQRWVLGKVTIIVPPRDGSSLDPRTVWDAIKWYADRYRVVLAIDPNAGGQQLAARIEDELLTDDGNGIVEVVEHDQRAPMVDAAMRTVEAIRRGEFAYGGAEGWEAWEQQTLTAVALPVAGGNEELFRFDKPRSRRAARRARGEEREFRCIDALDATAMAIRVGSTYEEEDQPELWAA